MYTVESFGTSELKDLTAMRARPCISIYLPTAESGRETMQGAIHLKNLLTEVKGELENVGARWDNIAGLLDKVEEMVGDRDFWQHQSHGLAIFVAPGVFRVFGLPITVPARQAVGETFDVTPLLPLLSNDGRFYILALSENDVRLIDATRYEFAEVKVEGMPTSMEDTEAGEAPERQQQRHGGAGGAPTYFGSGNINDSDQHKKNLKRYFDQVDAALTPYLNEHPAPMVLAGVEYLLPIYRAANTNARILDGEIPGNKDRTSLEDLHKAAWEIVAPHFAEAQMKAKDLFHQLLGTGTASAEAVEIGLAADVGRIATLFVALDDERSPTANRVAVATLTKGGEVFAMDQEAMPADQPLAAIFRY